MTTGEYAPGIPTSKEFSGQGKKTLTFADGTKATMQAVVYEVFRPSDADIKGGEKRQGIHLYTNVTRGTVALSS